MRTLADYCTGNDLSNVYSWVHLPFHVIGGLLHGVGFTQSQIIALEMIYLMCTFGCIARDLSSVSYSFM